MLVLLPYHNPSKRYIYALDLKHHLAGILVPRKKRCVIRDLVPVFEAEEVPVLKDGTYYVESYTRFRLRGGSYPKIFLPARKVYDLVYQSLSWLMWEEPKGVSVQRVWQTLRSLVYYPRHLRAFYVISRKKVYSMNSCPKNLRVRKFAILNYVVVMLT